MDIKLIKQDEIDKVKWNSCIHYASQGNIFGYMWYLNNTAKEWDALVEGDYESVLPLIHRSTRFKGAQLYQPVLIRSCGIYSIHVLSQKRVRSFLEAIPPEYKTVDLPLNEGLSVPDQKRFKEFTEHNYLMLLEPSYDELAENYSSTALRGLEKAQQANLIPVSNLKPEAIADFYKAQHPDRSYHREVYFASMRIMYNALHRGWGFGTGVGDSDGNLAAVTFVMYSHGRGMRLLSATSKWGRENGADYFMTDMLFRSHAGRPMIFDFNVDALTETWPKEMGADSVPFSRLVAKRSIFAF